MKHLLSFFLFIGIISPASATEVSKSEWLQAMEIALPAAFCKSEQYFRQCYTIMATECEEIASSTTRLCLNKFKDQIPDVLQQPNDGTLWGSKVGECAGAAFDVSMADKRVNSDRCNDPANWQ